MKASRKRKLFIKLFSILLVCIAIGAVIFAVFGERMVTDLYNGNLPFTGIELFSETPDRPLDYYLDRADIIVWDFIVVGLPLTILFWTVVCFAFKKLLSGPYTGTEYHPAPSEFKFDWLAGLLIYCGITALYCLPVLGKLTTEMLGPPEDNMFFYWNFWWVIEKVLSGEGTLTFTEYMFYPDGANLFYHSWSFYSIGVAALLGQFFDITTTYNIIALHSYPLSGLTAFMLVKYLTRNSYLALLGGFIFAFCPYHFGRTLHHMNLNSIHFIPLFVLYHLRSVREPGYSNAILSALFLLLSTLCSWVYLVLGLYFLILSYGYLAIRRKRVLIRDIFAKTVLTAGLVFLTVSPWLVKMMTIGLSGTDVKGVGRTKFVTDVFSLITPGKFHWAGGIEPISRINSTFTGNAWEIATYLGIFALAVVAIVYIRRYGDIRKYLAGALAFVLLSLGPELHILGRVLPIALPDTVIAYVPFFSSLRTPVRNILFVYVFWSILVPIASAALIAQMRTRWIRILLIAVIPSLIFLDYFKMFHETAEIVVPECYDRIPAEDADVPLLDLPTGYVAMQYYKYYQAHHNHPIVQGHTSRKLEETLIDTLDLENPDNQRRQLESAGVPYIIFHKSLEADKDRDEVRRSWYDSTYQIICEDSLTVLYRVY